MNYFETDEFKDRSTIFSNRLANALRICDKSQKWLAEKANTTEATISRYIKKVNRPAFAVTLSDIATALNVSADYLIGVSDKPQTTNNLTDKELILLDCFKKASATDVTVIWTLLAKYMDNNDKSIIF